MLKLRKIGHFMFFWPLCSVSPGFLANLGLVFTIIDKICCNIFYSYILILCNWFWQGGVLKVEENSRFKHLRTMCLVSSDFWADIPYTTFDINGWGIYCSFVPNCFYFPIEAGKEQCSNLRITVLFNFFWPGLFLFCFPKIFLNL